MPMRNFTVTGTSPAAATAAPTMRRSSVRLNGSADAAAVPGDLRHGATEVQVDVVDAVGRRRSRRTASPIVAGSVAVELDRPGPLVLGSNRRHAPACARCPRPAPGP